MDGDFKLQKRTLCAFLILITARAASGEKCGGLCGKARAKREAHYRASLAASEKQRAANAFAHTPPPFFYLHACCGFVMNSVAARESRNSG
jgi:hypothetical protein